MKSSAPFLTTAILIIFLGCNSPSQKKPVNYTDYDRGYSLWCNYKLDSAFLMLNRYVDKADDTLKKGKAYWMMGDIQWSIGDLYGAQENLTGTFRTLDPNNEKNLEDLAIAYNILGNVSLDLKQYDEAIRLYDIAGVFSKGRDYLIEVLNGKATALQKKGSYKAAIAVYDSILSLNAAGQQLLCRIIDNRARTKWLQDPAYNALPEFWSALKIRTDSNYNWGLNASYAHLSEYYIKSKPDSALLYAQKMYLKARDNQSPDDVLEAIDKLIRLTNPADLKERWYVEYKKLNDSLLFSRDTTRNRFAMIRYDVQKNKADNLVLQQNVTKQRYGIFGLIVFAITIITLLSVWYDKRRKRIRLEAENEIRNSRLKTSRKVHDVVANGLYGIMNELEHKSTIDKEPLINKIEDLYEKSRNISHEETPSDNDIAYDTQIHDLLNAFSDEETSVFIVGNQPEFWSNITNVQKQELQLALKELLVNMKKHSNAKNVIVQFKKDAGLVHILYKDDGVGFSGNGARPGKGLKNTVSRINSLNGDVTFGKNEKGGASVAIHFPLQSEKL